MNNKVHDESIAEFIYPIKLTGHNDFVLVSVFDDEDILTKVVKDIEINSGITPNELEYSANTTYSIGENGDLLFQIFIADAGNYWGGVGHEFQHVIELLKKYRPILYKDEEAIPTIAGDFWCMYHIWHNTYYHKIEVDISNMV